jgi:alpha-ketoglutarate-dependent taurine dioxygenase
MIHVDLNDRLSELGNAAEVSPIENPSHYEQLAADLLHEILTPAKIVQIVSTLESDGYVIISTDLGDYASPTPVSLTEEYSGPYFGEVVISLVSKVFGTLQSLSHQHNGRPFHDVMPIQAYQQEQTSGSSDVLLEMHTELSFVDVPPEYLMLFCVREDPDRQAETHLFDSRRAISKLDAETYACLSTPNFSFRMDDNATSNEDVSDEPVAIIDGPSIKLLRFDVDTCIPLSSEAERAAKLLENALLSHKVSVRLETGQILVVDNKRIVHSRGAFSANYDGKDRWLKRALVRRH